MRQILEKCYECHIEMHVLFIDFKQAFDSVDRQKTVQILQELRIPSKLVRIVKMTLQNTEASVKIENLIGCRIRKNQLDVTGIDVYSH